MREGSAMSAASDAVLIIDPPPAEIICGIACLQATMKLRTFVTIIWSQTSTGVPMARSEEHTSELQSLMRISYAVFCLKKKTTKTTYQEQHTINCQQM